MVIRSSLVSFLFTVILTLLPSVAASQEEGPMPMTWFRMVKTKPGAGPNFEKTFEKYEQPLLDRLVADGTALSWGLGFELVGPGGFDYLVWVNALGWAGIGEVQAVFDARRENMSEGELGKMTEDWMAVIEPGEEPSQVLRHVVVDGNPDVQPNYLHMSYHTARPGNSDDLIKIYRSFSVPVYAGLLETGVITAYGMVEQAVHSDSSFTHLAWIEFESLADLDKVERAFVNTDAEVSEGDGVVRKLAFMGIVQPEAHYCRLIRKLKQGG